MPRQSARINKSVDNAGVDAPAQPPQEANATTSRTQKRKASSTNTRASKRLRRESVSPQPEEAPKDEVEASAAQATVEEDAEKPEVPDESPVPERTQATEEPALKQEIIQPDADIQEEPPDDATQDLATAAVQKAVAASLAVFDGAEGNVTTDPAPPVPQPSLSKDPAKSLKLYNLHILGLLAEQIIRHILSCSYAQIQEACENSDSEHGKAWSTTRSLFSIAKALYPGDKRLLDPNGLGLNSETQRLDLQRTNIATAISDILCSDEADILDFEAQFLTICVRSTAHLESWQCDFLLELKTQAYMKALRSGESNPEQVVEQFFSANLESQLKSRHADATLSQPEIDFLRAAWGRSEDLIAISAESLTSHYDWASFRKVVSSHLVRILQEFFPEPSPEVRASVETSHETSNPADNPLTTSPEMDWMSNSRQMEFDDQGFDEDEMLRSAVSAAHGLLNGPTMNTSPYETSHSFSNIGHNNIESGNQNSLSTYQHTYQTGTALGDDGNNSTQALYEKARLAATAKASSKNRGTTSTPSQRRPWSAEEENALMAGLDMVKGPHWSQILAMFGTGGTVSEVLKDRNQVQLKDKARNLKLFFLKSGNEVPNYLQHVTGELKTRAPNQALKHEARDRLRESTNEDKATVDAITALAGGRLQTTDLDTGDDDTSLAGSSGGSTPAQEPFRRGEVEAARAAAHAALDSQPQPGSDQALAFALSQEMNGNR